jgi:hypothetical protein
VPKRFDGLAATPNEASLKKTQQARISADGD